MSDMRYTVVERCGQCKWYVDEAGWCQLWLNIHWGDKDIPNYYRYVDECAEIPDWCPLPVSKECKL